MITSVEQAATGIAPLPRYREILLAVDSSDHANRGVDDGTALATLWDARVTAAHVYAAGMRDWQFRHMEGGLPEQFRNSVLSNNTPAHIPAGMQDIALASATIR